MTLVLVIVLIQMPEAIGTKKLKNRAYLKKKIFCPAKKTTNTVKRQSTKEIAKHTSDKGLMSKKHKGLIQLKTK